MTINIKVTDLKMMVDELIADKVDYVELMYLESEIFDDEVIPATLHFTSFDGYGGGCEYDPIEEIEVNVFYRLMK